MKNKYKETFTAGFQHAYWLHTTNVSASERCEQAWQDYLQKLDKETREKIIHEE